MFKQLRKIYYINKRRNSYHNNKYIQKGSKDSGVHRFLAGGCEPLGVEKMGGQAFLISILRVRVLTLLKFSELNFAIVIFA